MRSVTDRSRIRAAYSDPSRTANWRPLLWALLPIAAVALAWGLL